MVTVILNCFKRQDLLERQITSVRNQSETVDQILIWNNGAHIDQVPAGDDICLVQSSQNFGVWARFAFALNAKSEFICLFDDDTLPGHNFLRNCLSCMAQEEALYGARGLRFNSKRYYSSYDEFGWGAPSEASHAVDIVGHAWFMRREWLAAFWSEPPSLDVPFTVGEDIHLSYTLQKYLGIRTKVPPHPISDTSLWGSLPEYGQTYGVNKAAVSMQPKAMEKFDIALRHYCHKGFVLLKDQPDVDIDRSKSALVVPQISLLVQLKRFIKNKPFLYRIFMLIRRVLLILGIKA